jgi:[acyl-carrier-protein] S-malonyltransferase
MYEIGIIFPGQGSQYVGMGKDFYDNYSVVREMFHTAGDIVGYDVKSLIFEGPKEKLKETLFTQVCVYLVSVAMFEVFKQSNKCDVKKCIFAGHSLGEYSALYASGAVDFATGMRLVKRRAELISECAQRTKSGMVAAIGLDKSIVVEICENVKSKGLVVEPANFNSPKQIVISGEEEGLREASLIIKEKGGKPIPLEVSGGFHSSLMDGAAETFAKEIGKYDIRDPLTAIVSNYDAKISTDKETIKYKLVKQINHPVYWQDCVYTMINAGVRKFIEIGPKAVLTGLMKHIFPESPYYQDVVVLSISTVEELIAYQ